MKSLNSCNQLLKGKSDTWDTYLESAGKDLKKMTMIVNEKKGRGKRRTNWTSIVFENMKIKDMRTAELKANDKEKWKRMEDGT